MAKEYVVTDAKLECNFGTAPSNLVVLPLHRVRLTGKYKANLSDCVPNVNVMPFGNCRSLANPATAAATAANKGKLKPMPCTPACSRWLGGKPDVLIDGDPALMKEDKALCPLGAGMIKVVENGQGSSSSGGEVTVDGLRAKKAREKDSSIIVDEDRAQAPEKDAAEDELSKRIKEAIAARERAKELAGEYNSRYARKKTVASDGATTLSGWRKLPEYTSSVSRTTRDNAGNDIRLTDAVLGKAEEMGYVLTPAGARDHGVPGQFNASHAEKQLSCLTTDPIGVSQEMCEDCQAYFTALAQHEKRQVVIADPCCVRVFNPDGSVGHYNDEGLAI
ncbi:MAG: DUF4280 domain-containing protein [Clostridiales bacterium]|nr:DUF4280 domain-containing protein [Clostridiales bacterium]